MASSFTGKIHTTPSGTVVTQWQNASGELWYMDKIDVRMHQMLYSGSKVPDDLVLAELYLKDHDGWWPHPLAA